MINLVIIIWGGLIEDVKAFRKDSDAFDFFEEKTHVSWKDFTERLAHNESSETILRDYTGSDIRVIPVQS